MRFAVGQGEETTDERPTGTSTASYSLIVWWPIMMKLEYDFDFFCH